MLTMTIDGQEVQAKKGATVLEVAREHGIEIPTLCYHEALSPYAGCRLCIVEVTRGKRTRIVTSCTYPVQEDGLVINTKSRDVIKGRKMVVELLLARCPESEKLQELAHQFGLKKPRFRLKDSDCILCGLCLRVCQEIIGKSAISFINRGPAREVTTPFKMSSEACIGCGACALVCPTGAIKIQDIEDSRIMENWKTTLELKKCKDCGNYFAPKKELDCLKEKIKDLPEDLFETCQNCRKKALKSNLVEIRELISR